MSQLARLLGHDHPLFAYNLAQLERATGGDGVDTRLIADITDRATQVLRALNLDPADTRPQELYRAVEATVLDGRAQELLRDTSYVLWDCDGEIISLNYQDVVESFHHELFFDTRATESGKRHLRAEIIRRYAEHDRTDNAIVQRLAAEAGLTPARDEGHHDVQLLLTAGSSEPQAEAVVVELPDTTPTLLAIGDIFTDAFIQLGEDAAKVIEDESGKWLAVPYGQKPPYERVDIVRSVGPSPNAAVSTARLGLQVSLMAWVGGDEVGKEALAHLRNEQISTDSMVVEADKATSYWYVLRYGADRTMLVKSEQYGYKWQDPAVAPDWVYLSYIGEDSWGLHEQLLEYLGRNPQTRLVFQPGTFHFEWGPEKLAAIYARSELVVMNREEAMSVTGRGYDDLRQLADGLHELGPRIVVITDGPNGSYASFDGRLVTIPNYPDVAPPLDRTGAGDAFASTIVAALALGETMETALTWAPINSMNVVQQLGAQAGLQSRAQIEDWLTKAPEDYRVTDL